ncbi:MAG TPA: nucleoside triphosphate pyrophosphohydrolase [Methylomirabilota bacterium]|jgi:tetrapyrrole methylase family protein/MazG family protein|nr:nucleoside triphosphate pyrophosphohydrolase [Methylomirabilota bacterium]
MQGSDPGQRFVELLAVMARLRDEGGCPWDREQTRESLRPFLVEEAYEVLEALESDEAPRIMEELGDLLFQVVFHTKIARERGEFTMADLLAALTEKMVRRHPHVFGDRVIGTAAEALTQWEAIKQGEGATRRSALHGIPRSLPGLLRAQRIQHRASRVGFDWPDPQGALEKVREEVAELGTALEARAPERIRAEIGDLLFSVVNVARLAGTDPEAALQDTAERFSTRFRHMEDAADAEGRELRSLTLSEMERLWLEAKARES